MHCRALEVVEDKPLIHEFHKLHGGKATLETWSTKSLAVLLQEPQDRGHLKMTTEY